MFIINPDPYSLPCYRIGPFQTRDISINNDLPDSTLIDEYFKQRFGDQNFMYTENGRQAIHTALEYFQLEKEDVVTILTTTGNFYISGCVTKEIEKFCKWSREIVPETKLIFVNHEFGFPYNELHKLKEYNLPIIEDCAGSFYSHDKHNETGRIGDFTIYSFPKMFPLQIGGLLVSKNTIDIGNKCLVPEDTLLYIKNVLSHYIRSKEEVIANRIYNYEFLKSKFETIGFSARFELDKGAVPGVFMFQTKLKKINMPELKSYFYSHGVQCSVFYGEDAFFLPVHQGLTEQDMLYFFEVMKSFIK